MRTQHTALHSQASTLIHLWGEEANWTELNRTQNHLSGNKENWKSKPDLRRQIQRKEHWWLGSKPTKQWRWWHRASWELLFGRFRRKTEDEDVGGKEGRGQEWYGYHGKMCRIKSHGTSPVILPGWIWTSIKTHAREKQKWYILIGKMKEKAKLHSQMNKQTRQYTIIQSNQTGESDNCIQMDGPNGWRQQMMWKLSLSAFTVFINTKLTYYSYCNATWFGHMIFN